MQVRRLLRALKRLGDKVVVHGLRGLQFNPQDRWRYRAGGGRKLADQLMSHHNRARWTLSSTQAKLISRPRFTYLANRGLFCSLDPESSQVGALEDYARTSIPLATEKSRPFLGPLPEASFAIIAPLREIIPGLARRSPDGPKTSTL